MNNLKQISLLAIFLSLSLFGRNYSQITDPVKFEESLKNASFKEKFETANSLMEDNLYEFAIKIWLNLIEEDPTNSNINYKLGLCYLNSSTERKKALKYLLVADENVSRKYDPFTAGERNAPFEAHFYLGKAYHSNENFEMALEEFEEFQGEINKKHKLYEENELHLIYVNNAIKEVASKKNFQIENIGVPINGAFSDFSPVITADESAIFFTSRRTRTDTTQVSNKKVFSPQDGKHYEDVYVSYKDMKTEKWGEPELMQFSSPRSNQATISVSGDGQFLFIYKDDNGDGNIYVSEREDINYGTPTYMGGENSSIDINTIYWETHATLSADGKTLYFVSDRPGGLGGRDIYRSVKLPNGQWSKALNVGAPINTVHDEESPFFHPDGKTLYFSSNGTKSMGGFDIFFTKMGNDNKWSTPLNIGYPLNTVDDDVFFSTSVDGKKGYYSSAHDGGFGEKDIYTIKLDTSVVEQIAILKGYIDPGTETELPSGIVIWVSDLTEGGDPLKYQPNRRTGSYIFSLIPCHEYGVEYMRSGTTFYETEIKVPCNSDYHVINKIITLEGISLGPDVAGVDSPIDTTITTTPVDTTVLTDNTVDPQLQKKKEKWKYQVFIDDKPYYLDGLAEIMDQENSEYSELISKGGFKYRELQSKKDPFFEIETDDVTLCDKIAIKILDENGKVIKVTTRNIRCKITSVDIVPVSFQKYYNYNEKGLKSEEERFIAFLNGVKDILDKKGNVSIEIEGSASYVPTKTFGSNEKLSAYRSNEAKEMLLKKLKENGINLTKVKIVAVNSIVQGPKYSGDFKNAEKYGKFQYIKLKAF